MENKKKGAIFLVLFVMALVFYCFVLSFLFNLLQPPKFPSPEESTPAANTTLLPPSIPAPEEPPSYSDGYLIFGLFSSLLTILLAMLGLISLFLANYYYSLAEKKRVWISTSLILIVLLVYIYFKTYNTPGGDITDLAFLGIMTIVIFALIVISGLVALFAKKIEKVKHSFVASFILFILWFLCMVIASIVEKGSLRNRAPGIAIGFLGAAISLVILIPINIYLNKKQAEEKKKKRIIVIYVPLVIIILLALIWGVLFLLFNK